MYPGGIRSAMGRGRGAALVGLALIALSVLGTPGVGAAPATDPAARTAQDDGPADPPAVQRCRAPRVNGGKVSRLRKNARETCTDARRTARAWVRSARRRRETLGLTRCRGRRAVSCVAAGAKGYARVTFRWTPARPTITYRPCPSFTVGLTTFSRIGVAKVGCEEARGLLDRATLAANRRGRTRWSYAGWAWAARSVGETSAKISGKRVGGRRMRALQSTR